MRASVRQLSCKRLQNEAQSKQFETKQVCVEPRPSGLNMTLPAYAAERRRLQLFDRYLLQAPALSSKPAARRRCCRSTGQTDGRTDGRTPDSYIDPASLAMRAAASVYNMSTRTKFIAQKLR